MAREKDLGIGRGVKKVNESIFQDGRTLIITEDDINKLDWDRVPNGTLKVHPSTGAVMVKVQGEGGWIPAGLSYDGKISVAREVKIVYEVFTIKRKDNGDGTFTYTRKNGDQRTKPLTAEGKQTFELEDGSYIIRQNKLEAFINDTVHVSEGSGGLIEIDQTRFALEEKAEIGTVITAKYFERVNIGDLYPRFWVSKEVPEKAEYGNLWIDLNESPSSFKWWNGSEWLVANSREFDTIIGGGAIYAGFEIEPALNKAVIVKNGGMLAINGAIHTEVNASIAVPIPDNGTAAPRTDSLYAVIENSVLSYKIAVGTTVVPRHSCKLAEITIGVEAPLILAKDIKIEPRILTILDISKILNDATSFSTPGSIVKRDDGGRLRSATPVHEDDVARKKEVDAAMKKASDAVAKTGDTMTGNLNITGHGIHPSIAVLPATTSGASYPQGMSMTQNPTINGYPEVGGAIITFKHNATSATQWFYPKINPAMIRNWDSVTGWSVFKRVQQDITGAASTVVTSNLGSGKVVITDGSGKIAISTVTAVELDYLKNAESSVDSKIQAVKNEAQKTVTSATMPTISIGDQWHKEV